MKSEYEAKATAMKGACSDEEYDEKYFQEIHTSIHGMTSPTELGYPNKEETE